MLYYLVLSKHIFIHMELISTVYVNLLVSNIQLYFGACTIITVSADVLRVAENVLSLHSSSPHPRGVPRLIWCHRFLFLCNSCVAVGVCGGVEIHSLPSSGA